MGAELDRLVQTRGADGLILAPADLYERRARSDYLGTTAGLKVHPWDAYANGPADPAPAGVVDPGPMSVYAEYTQ